MTIHVKRYPEMFTHLDMSDPESFPEFLKVTGIIPDSQSRVPLSGMWNDLENALMEKEHPSLVHISDTVLVQEVYGNGIDLTGRWFVLTHSQFHFLYREKTKSDELSSGLATGDHVTFYDMEGILDSRSHIAEMRHGEEMWNVKWEDSANVTSPIGAKNLKRVFPDFAPAAESDHNEDALKRYLMMLAMYGGIVSVLKQIPYGESNSIMTGVIFQVGAQRYLAQHMTDTEHRHTSVCIVDADDIEAAYGFPVSKDNIISIIDRVDYPRNKQSPEILYGLFMNEESGFFEEVSAFEGDATEDRKMHAMLSAIRVLG